MAFTHTILLLLGKAERATYASTRNNIQTLVNFKDRQISATSRVFPGRIYWARGTAKCRYTFRKEIILWFFTHSNFVLTNIAHFSIHIMNHRVYRINPHLDIPMSGAEIVSLIILDMIPCLLPNYNIFKRKALISHIFYIRYLFNTNIQLQLSTPRTKTKQPRFCRQKHLSLTRFPRFYEAFPGPESSPSQQHSIIQNLLRSVQKSMLN